MRQYLEKIFQLGYTQYKGLGTSNGKEVADEISNLTNQIRNQVLKYSMKTEFSIGIGRWNAVPWIRVFYEDFSPSAKDGVYIVYLFDAAGKSVYLTLNQGTTDSSEEKRIQTRSIIQNKISSRNFLKNSGNLDFGDTKNYGQAAIFYKEYKFTTLPTDEVLNADLTEMLEIYNECREKGLLNNSKVISLLDQKSETIEVKTMKSQKFDLSSFSSSKIAFRYTASLIAKPFVILTGNSGTGKTRIATQFATWLQNNIKDDISNTLVVPVGADWTDNTKILGYFNPLANDGTGDFIKSDVLNFIEIAKENPQIPFFLILDEMNLSHVERYFSDFLSAMESEKPILLYKKPQNCISTVEETIILPKNLFVTGTVNIDETTYMFSPKVLDRANVIEFIPEKDDVLKIFSHKPERQEIQPAPDGMAEAFVELSEKVREFENGPLTDAGADLDGIFGELYDILKPAGFEFAYRTTKEIVFYYCAAHSLNNELTTLEIIDHQIVQKILPKIHGNKKQIGELLNKLKELLSKYDVLQLSQTKVNSMIDKLEKYQYASFI